MRIIAVENDIERINCLEKQLRNMHPNAEVECFNDPMLAIKSCYEHTTDLAVAGYDLKRMDGIAFLKLLRQMTPGITTILIDDGDMHFKDARNLMIGYLARPVTVEKLEAVLR